MTHLECYIDGCIHNVNRECIKSTISIHWKGSNEFSCGERIYYPICENYEETKDDGD